MNLGTERPLRVGGREQGSGCYYQSPGDRLAIRSLDRSSLSSLMGIRERETYSAFFLAPVLGSPASAFHEPNLVRRPLAKEPGKSVLPE